MHKRAIAASTAALFLTASSAFADTEYAVTATTMDWRLVVILTVLGLFAFYIALERVNRGR
jgi:hypothetical protein